MSTGISKTFVNSPSKYPKLPLSLGIDNKYVAKKVGDRNKDYGLKKVNL